MKRMLATVLLLVGSIYIFAQEKLPDWALGPFVRSANVNPVLSPDTNSIFTDPMSNTKIAWEASDVFNPAATIMNNKIYVLYRAEDSSGIGIVKRTSRLGLAESNDGIHMKRRPTPVLFPANDNQKEFEWPGGCEDPRIAVTEDGTYVMLYTQWNKKVPRLAVATSKDLTNWTVKIHHHDVGVNAGNTFRVEEGMIKVSYDQYGDFNDQFGHLYYDQPFSRFHMVVEYRFADTLQRGAPDYTLLNSGVMFHSQDPRSMPKEQNWTISV